MSYYARLRKSFWNAGGGESGLMRILPVPTEPQNGARVPSTLPISEKRMKRWRNKLGLERA
jgi:hypothetical protein